MSVVQYEEGTDGMIVDVKGEITDEDSTFVYVERSRGRGRVRINKRFIIKIDD